MNDAVLRDTLLAGLTDIEVSEVVGREMARRGKTGIMYFFTDGASGQTAAHVILAPLSSDLLTAPVDQQLYTFALHAKMTVKETEQIGSYAIVPDEN